MGLRRRAADRARYAEMSDSDRPRPALQVPEGHVERRYPERHQATVAVPVGRVAHASPESADVRWVFADEQGRQSPLDDEPYGQRGFLAAGDRLAPTGLAVIRLDPDERERPDLAGVLGSG